MKDKLKGIWKEVIMVYPTKVLQRHLTGWWKEETLLAENNTKTAGRIAGFPIWVQTVPPWNTSLALQIQCKGVLDEVMWYNLIFNLFIPAVFFECFRGFCSFQSIHSLYIYIYISCMSRGRHVSASLILGHLQVHRSLCSLQCQVWYGYILKHYYIKVYCN